MKKKFLILFTIVLLGMIIFIITKKTTKKNLFGNNRNSQEIVDYILDISSYEAIIDVEINSNKNKTKYELSQVYVKPDIFIQEVIKPENIKGVKIVRNGNELTLDNTKIGIRKIINDYDCINNNRMDLNTFIEIYNNNNNSSYKEKNEIIIMDTKFEGISQKLFINKKDEKPIKMEIIDNNKKNSIYILYKEITFNKTKKEEILAFENRIKNKQI